MKLYRHFAQPMLVYLKAFSQGLTPYLRRFPLSFVPTKETKALGCEK
jgi:hypothetical protein